MRIVSATRVLLAGAVVAVGALSGCGSSADEPAATGSGGTVTVDGISFPKPEKTSVSIAAPGKGSIGLVPFLMADKDGLWKKYGVNVEFHTFASDAQALQAILAGQADVGGTSGGPALSSLTSKTKLTFTYVGRDNLTDVLASRPEIDSPEKLKGKSIAISSFGAQSHAGAVLALQALGLDPKDVTLTQIGAGGSRLAALQSGAVGASIQDGIEMKALQAKGYHSLFMLNSLGAGKGFIRSGIDAPSDFVAENPNTMLALTAGMLEATTKVLDPANVDHAASVWAEESGQPLEKAKEEVQAEFTPENYKPASGRCTPELLNFMKSLLVSTNPKLNAVDATQACTNRFLDQLDRMGFTKAIGAQGA